MSTLDEVISTVRDARGDGPDALAAVAMSFGATMALGVVRNRAMRGQIAEMRAAMEATEATAATLRTERDAARDEAKAARQRMEEVREQCDRARTEASGPAVVEVWRLRESVAALRGRAEKAETERDAAVQEREAFSLRLSAAERERDEARAERDAALDRVQALHTEVVAIRADFGHQRDITEYAIRERDEARAERDALRDRPTYEARTTPPEPEEADAHESRGGIWYKVGHITYRGRVKPQRTVDSGTGASSGWITHWVPIGADGLPCAWPVVP